MNKFYFKAIYAAYPNAVTINSDSIVFDSDNNPIDIDQNAVSNKILELQAAEPMRLLREQRDCKIAATDWWVLPDRTPTQAQLDHRKALRDLPANSPNAALDEQGNLINVTWPEIPQ